MVATNLNIYFFRKAQLMVANYITLTVLLNSSKDYIYNFKGQNSVWSIWTIMLTFTKGHSPPRPITRYNLEKYKFLQLTLTLIAFHYLVTHKLISQLLLHPFTFPKHYQQLTLDTFTHWVITNHQQPSQKQFTK